MFKKKNFILGFVVLLMALLACASPTGTGQAPEPQNVQTIVAATFQALTAQPSNGGAPTPADLSNPLPPPVSTGGLLPYSMYFLNNDAAGIAQVYRLETDGKTLKQITFEPMNVERYDVSRIDGSVVYTTNNQLFTIRADGSNRTMLVDGGSVDPVNPYVNIISNPVFSPDGQTIAYSNKGLSFYSVATGQTNLVLANKLKDYGNNFLFPEELYSPEMYSADGSKLILTLGYYEGASAAIYYPASGNLVRLTNEQRAVVCCGETEWSPDYSAFYSASSTFGMFSAGLWRVDAATGSVTTLLSGNFDSNPIHLADEPFLAPDGSLYFFYGTAPAGSDMVQRPSLQLVRSALDGVTDRKVIRPEVFNTLNESLWAPDGSFVITAQGPIQDVYQGGLIELYYTDGQKPMISLVPFGRNLRWGP